MLHSIHHDVRPRFEWFRARLDRGVLHIPGRGIKSVEAPTVPALTSTPGAQRTEV
jgi:hypothetical protein